jgi:DNA primase
MDFRELLMNRVEVHDADEGEVMILCPFHGESNPSLSVNESSGVFICFSCKESGNFAKLLAELDGITIRDAKKLLREGETEDQVIQSIQKNLEDISEYDDDEERYYSVKSFHTKFPVVKGTPGEAYLQGRGILLEITERFDLRWGRDGVMKGRVVFPIYNPNGKLLSYGGRTVQKDVKPKTRKVKSSISQLYGLFELLQTGKKRFPYLVVVEGEFDAMYLQGKGIYAVSTMGTAALTTNQKALLKRHCELTVFCYDGDNAGRRAQKKAVIDVRKYTKCIGITMPEGKDPNELTDSEIKKLFKGVL